MDTIVMGWVLACSQLATCLGGLVGTVEGIGEDPKRGQVVLCRVKFKNGPLLLSLSDPAETLKSCQARGK
jgi:hypothetical protein